MARKIWAIPLIVLTVFPFFYFVCYYLGRISFESATGMPIDKLKWQSGIFLGGLVSTVPAFSTGWIIGSISRPKVMFHRNSLLVALYVIMMDKIMPLILAFLILLEAPSTSEGPFLLLGEEFPYFSFGYTYLLVSSALNYIFVYIGVRVEHHLRNKFLTIRT